MWKISPFNPSNNVNNTTEIEWKKLHTLENGNILGFQEKYARKLVDEARDFDNVIFEIQNEPWSDRPTLTSVVNPYLRPPGATSIPTLSTSPTIFRRVASARRRMDHAGRSPLPNTI